jgi:hypothetical protein
MAVGEADYTFKARPLVERWNGSSWSVSATPTLTYSARLNSVNCKSSTRCEAVGAIFAKGVGTQVLAEGWNGSSWLLQAAPNPSTYDSELHAVRCTQKPTFACIAVGHIFNGTDVAPLAERYA